MSRNAAEVLDRVQIERESLLVTRNGRPVATLSPVSALPREGQATLVVVLSPLQEKILLRVAGRAPQSTAYFEDLGDPLEADRAASQLELDGLLERDFGGYRITEHGRLVGAVLEARADA